MRGGSAIQTELNGRGLLEILKRFGPGNVSHALQILDSPTLDSNPDQRWEAISADGGTSLTLFRSKPEAELYCSEAEKLFYKKMKEWLLQKTK